MFALGAVTDKMECVFTREKIEDEPSPKREGQHYRVIATDVLNPRALESDVQNSIVTEKIDGTCCYVAEFEGIPCLWGRSALKSSDRPPPKYWQPAATDDEGYPEVTKYGSVLGWVPVLENTGTHKYHASAVNYGTNKVLLLKETDDGEDLEIALVPLANLLGRTVELIGSKINGNPYNLKPGFHVIVEHGAIRVKNPPELNTGALKAWFSQPHGQVEGIVWHCSDGNMFKIHVTHLELLKPKRCDMYLSNRAVRVNVQDETLTRKTTEDTPLTVSTLSLENASKRLSRQEKKQHAKSAQKQRRRLQDMPSVLATVHGQRFSSLTEIDVDQLKKMC